jgi:hypothetical protein
MEKRKTEGDNHGLLEHNDGCLVQKTDKNPNTQTVRKLMDQQGGKITLL